MRGRDGEGRGDGSARLGRGAVMAAGLTDLPNAFLVQVLGRLDSASIGSFVRALGYGRYLDLTFAPSLWPRPHSCCTTPGFTFLLPVLEEIASLGRFPPQLVSLAVSPGQSERFPATVTIKGLEMLFGRDKETLSESLARHVNAGLSGMGRSEGGYVEAARPDRGTLRLSLRNEKVLELCNEDLGARTRFSGRLHITRTALSTYRSLRGRLGDDDDNDDDVEDSREAGDMFVSKRQASVLLLCLQLREEIEGGGGRGDRVSAVLEGLFKQVSGQMLGDTTSDLTTMLRKMLYSGGGKQTKAKLLRARRANLFVIRKIVEVVEPLSLSMSCRPL